MYSRQLRKATGGNAAKSIKNRSVNVPKRTGLAPVEDKAIGRMVFQAAHPALARTLL
jgi:hypothetical protein